MRGKAFFELLDECVTDGSIEFVVAGESRRVGQKDGPPEVVVEVSDDRFLDQVLSYGNLALGEAFMRGDFGVRSGDVAGFIGVLLRNHLDDALRQRLGLAMALKMAAIRLTNRLRGPVGNVHKHFDVGNDLYEAFLDSSLAYTCGYEAGDGHSSLEELQQQKYHRICTKLQLAPGDRLADLGCGFGGLLIYAAEHHGITGKGFTISKKQAEKAAERIAAKGLGDRIRVEYASYATLTGTWDKIVSVGMMEHLRDDEYPGCVRLIARSLTPQGRGLLHFIGYNGPKNHSDPFVQKHIFPGAQWPKLSLLVGQLELASLGILDVENLVRHYNLTLRAWLAKFRAAYPGLDHTRYPETFRRLWEYYLGCSVAATLYSQVALYQILFTKDYAAPIPYQRV
ncbi:MAG TPA: class I SAM-dependent methyltransferase [Thermoanaerobaculia bacterium]|nr:class I SAM-dependent methyltransferase [Thermoanaerobaculia bacterium]